MLTFPGFRLFNGYADHLFIKAYGVSSP